MAYNFEKFLSFPRELIECPICFQTFEQPKALPCQHTFCLACIERLRSSTNNLTCPICQKVTCLSGKDTTDIPTNFFIVQLLDSLRPTETDTADTTLCDVCSTSPSRLGEVAKATAYCPDCEQKLCQTCVNAHSGIRPLKNHRLVEIDSNDAGELRQLLTNRTVYCAEHTSNEIAFYCTECLTPICVKCGFLKHRNHNCLDIHEKANESRQDVDKIVETLSHQMSEFKSSDLELQRDLTDLNDTIQRIENEINLKTKEVISYVRFQQKTLIQILKESEKCFKSSVELSLNDIHSKITSLDNFIRFCRQLKDGGTATDVIHLWPQLESKCIEYQAMRPTPIYVPEISFTPAADVTSRNVFIGKVLVANSMEEETNKSNILEEQHRFREEITSSNETDLEEKTNKSNILEENHRCCGEITSSIETDTDNSNLVKISIPENAEKRIDSDMILGTTPEQTWTELLEPELSLSEQETQSNEHVDDEVLQVLYPKQHKGFETNDELSLVETLTKHDSSIDDCDESIDSNSENSDSYEPGDKNKATDPEKSNFGLHFDRQFSWAENDSNANNILNEAETAGGNRSNRTSAPVSRSCSTDMETNSGQGSIVGLTALDRLYIIRKNADHLEMYDLETFCLIGTKTIPEIQEPTDLTASRMSQSLYIGHTRKVVFYVDVTQDGLTPKRLTVALNYKHISATNNGSVLMGCPKSDKILEYKEAPDWKELRRIRLPGVYPTGMVQVSTNRFVVSSKMNVVYLLTTRGSSVDSRCVPVPHNISYIAADFSGSSLLVADCYGHKIQRLELDSADTWSTQLVQPKTISKPCRLWTDKVNKRLFVGTCNGEVRVLPLY